MTQFPSAPPLGPQYPPFPGGQVRSRSSAISILALVFGGVALLLGLIPVAGVVLALVFGIPAVVLGIIGVVKSHKIMAIIGLVLAVIGVAASFAITVATIGAVETSLEEGAPPRDDPSSDIAEDEEVDTAADTASGDTPDSPFPAGTEVETGDWNVSFSDIVPNADDIILEENMFNEEPEDGFQYFMYQVNATYIGDETGVMWIDLNFGVYLDETVFTASCGVTPNDVFAAPEVYKGGEVTANVCVAVPTDGVDEALITVEETWTFDGDRFFVETN